MPMPKKASEPKTKPSVPELSRIGADTNLQSLFGGGAEFPEERPVPEVPGPRILTASCGLCMDGWIYEQRANGDRSARECACRSEVRFAAQLRRASLPDRYLTASFESYRPAAPSQQAALIKARGLANAWPGERGRGLALIGPVGTGKTHLAVSMLRVMLTRGATCRFCNVKRVLDEIKETFTNRERAEADILRPIFAADVVVFDELGAERYTDWTKDIVEKLINTRYDDNKATTVTSNLAFRATGRQIERTDRPYAVESYAAAMQQDALGDQIGLRMLSRLQEMCDVVEVLGEDYRARGRR